MIPPFLGAQYTIRTCRHTTQVRSRAKRVKSHQRERGKGGVEDGEVRKCYGFEPVEREDMSMMRIKSTSNSKSTVPVVGTRLFVEGET